MGEASGIRPLRGAEVREMLVMASRRSPKEVDAFCAYLGTSCEKLAFEARDAGTLTATDRERGIMQAGYVTGWIFGAMQATAAFKRATEGGA